MIPKLNPDNYAISGSVKKTQSRERHVLVIEAGYRRAIALEAATYSIGRDPTNAIVLQGTKISRQHAILLRVPAPNPNCYRYKLLDGNLRGRRSANGITVNGQACTSCQLEGGDVIRFGGEVEAHYLILAITDAEFAGYIESINARSLKADPVISQETLVGVKFPQRPDGAAPQDDPPPTAGIPKRRR